MDLSAILEIVSLVAIITFIVLAIFIMITLNSATKLIDEASKSLERLSNNLSESMKQIQIDMDDLKDKVGHSLQKFDKLAGSLNSTTEKVENEVDKYINAISPIHNLIKYSFNKIAPPVSTTVITLSAVFKAINAFTSHLSKK